MFIYINDNYNSNYEGNQLTKFIHSVNYSEQEGFMYIGVCVYNALSRLARRVKMSRNVVTVSIGAMAILAGISISLTPNPSDLMKLIMVILVFGGLIVCAMSYGQAHKDDWRELDRQRSEFYKANKQISELQSINKGISELGELLKEIRSKF